MIRQKLTVAAGILALTILPMARPSIAQATPTPGAVSEILNSLELTPEQKPKVDKIQDDAAVKIKAVLDAEQLKQLSVISSAGKADSEAFKTLNLSEDQKTKLNEVQMGVAQELFSVLTPDQQQKLIDQMMSRTGASK
jgi:Spy/CpxP family protein refolding chaperone